MAGRLSPCGTPEQSLGPHAPTRSRLGPDLGWSFLVATHQKGRVPMTLEELLALLLPILPNLIVDEETDGEILIYTGFRKTDDGRLEQVAA